LDLLAIDRPDADDPRRGGGRCFSWRETPASGSESAKIYISTLFDMIACRESTPASKEQPPRDKVRSHKSIRCESPSKRGGEIKLRARCFFCHVGP